MSDADKEKDIILGFLVVVSALLTIAVALLIYCWWQKRRRRPYEETEETGKAREAAGCPDRASTEPAAPDTLTQDDRSQQTTAAALNGCTTVANGSALDTSSSANNSDIKADDCCALSSCSSSNISNSNNNSSNNSNVNNMPGFEADATREVIDRACSADAEMDGDCSLQQEIPIPTTSTEIDVTNQARRPNSGGGIAECGGAAHTQLGGAERHVYHILEPDFKGSKGRGVLFALDQQCSCGAGQADEAVFADHARSDTNTGLLKASDYAQCIKSIDGSLTNAGSASTNHDSAPTALDNKVRDCEVADVGVYEDVQLQPHPLWPLTSSGAASSKGQNQNLISPATLSLSSPSPRSKYICGDPSRQSGYEDVEFRPAPALQNVNPESEPRTHEASSGVDSRLRSRSDGQYEDLGDLLDWNALFALSLLHTAEGLRSIAGSESVSASCSDFPIGLPFHSHIQSERTYEPIEVMPNPRLLPVLVQLDLPASRPPLAAPHAAGDPREATRPQVATGPYDEVVLHSHLDLPAHVEGLGYGTKTDPVTDSNERSANSPSGTQNQPSESESHATYAYAIPCKRKTGPKYNAAREETQQQAQSEGHEALIPPVLAEHDSSSVSAIKTVQNGLQAASDSIGECSGPDCRVQQRSASEPTTPDALGLADLPPEALDTTGVYVRLRVVAATSSVGGLGDSNPEDQSGVKDNNK